jgi:hypothetical protein
MKNYYGFEYADGTHTTTGEPNKGFERFNGRLSIAGKAVVFDSLKKRSEWLNGKCNSFGGRIPVNRRQLRNLCAGMENENFQNYLNYVIEG